ncbi:unnamed protein product [Zymoseptoria tritici ST99CH_1E4]|nr:unnamed protein product [Zymoseptoria tritici ST99CH_1E4]
MSTAAAPLAISSLGAFAAGTGLYWLYFNRFETHMHALRFINTFLLANIAGFFALTASYGLTTSAAFSTLTWASGALLAALFGNCLVYRLLLNPLNRFPGPYPARISNFWLSTQLAAKSDGYYWLQAQHKKHGKIVRIGTNDLSITDPEIMELAYGAKSRVTKSIWYDGDKPLTSMQTSRDKGLHDRRRRVWAPAFSEKAIRDYETEIQTFNDKFLTKIAEHGDKPVNLTKWFNLFSFDAMGLLAFGRDYGMLDKGEKPHELEMLDEGMQPLAYRLPLWFFRLLTAIPGLSAGYQKFVNFCVSELTWRVQNEGNTKRDVDIMGWLLKAYKDVPHPEKDTMLQADARLIIVAGSDTTAATFTYLFFHLAQNPEIVEKLREELDPLTTGDWQDKDIRNAPILNGCINEALRMHPPVPSGVERLTPPEGLKVGDTWIPGNVQFVTPMFVMGRDPDIYAQPDTFLPERWSTQSDKVKHKDAFAPFSMGPMGCIGKNLALMELRTLTTRRRTELKAVSSLRLGFIFLSSSTTLTPIQSITPHNTATMSAITEEPEGVFEPLKVLITLHDNMDTMDAVGPLEVFSWAQHDAKNPDSKAFRTIFAGPQEHVTTLQGASLRAHITYDEALKRLSEIDVLVIPGGSHEDVVKNKKQPLSLIKAFAELQKKNPNRERSLMSVCTGSLFLAEAGILSGLTATTHPDFITKFEIACSNVAQRDMAERVDVVEERYVVNNLRFDLGENEDENPYVLTRKELKEHKRRKSSAGGISPIEEVTNGSGRRMSNARKGSMSLKLSNNRRESVLKRANLRLGGLRVLTTSGVTSGMDGALYLVGALVSDDAADEVARKMCYKWQKGMVVDGVDV